MALIAFEEMQNAGAEMPIIVGGHNIVESASVVFQKGQTAQIFPFADDPTYCIEFAVDWRADGLSTINQRPSGDHSTLVEFIIGAEALPEMAPAEPVRVADINNTTAAFTNVAINCIGTTERYTALLVYTVYIADISNG